MAPHTFDITKILKKFVKKCLIPMRMCPIPLI